MLSIFSCRHTNWYIYIQSSFQHYEFSFSVSFLPQKLPEHLLCIRLNLYQTSPHPRTHKTVVIREGLCNKISAPSSAIPDNFLWVACGSTLALFFDEFRLNLRLSFTKYGVRLLSLKTDWD